MKSKLLALCLSAALLAGALAGCGGTGTETAQSASTAAASSAPTENKAEPTEKSVSEESASNEASTAPEAAKAIVYPLQGDDLTLSVFTSFPGNLSSYMSSFADHPAFQAAQKATGISIDFTEVSMENAATQFELMVASDNFTDIVIGMDDLYTGGMTAAYEQDAIYNVEPYLADYAPDYLAAINSNDAYQDFAYEKDGSMLAVYSLYLYDYSSVTNGIFIRQDWLDDLGLDTPVTYDDWHKTLTAFQSSKGATAALLLPNGSESRGATYAGGYHTAGYSTDARMSGAHFYQVDGKVTSSLIDDNYLDYLTMLHQWYSEGLIYQDFYSNETRDIMDPLINGNQVGIFDGKVDFITKYESSDTTGTLKLTGIANPVKEAGDLSGFGDYVNEKGSTCVTTACDNPEVAMEWLNYFFTKDGILLANYGEEGVSYELDDQGNPTFTDLILHNEDPQLQYGNVTRLYLLDEVVPTVYDQTRELAAYSQTEQAAIKTWSDSKEARYTLPSITLDQEENTEFSSLLTDVETYASENVIKFIIGEKDLSEWADFTSNLKTVGIDRCIEIYQNALDAA